MDLIASYLALDAITLNEVIDLVDNREVDDEVLDRVEELLNDEDIEQLELEGYWDIFHYLFNNVSALQALNTPLSQVILGCSRADIDEYLAIIEPQEVNDILDALARVDFYSLLANIDLKSIADAKIYPSIWENIDIEELKESLSIIYEDMILFYQDIKKNKQGVLVTIL